MKVAVVVTENYSAWNFRGGLLRSAVNSGLDAYLIAPSGDYDASFEEMGVRLVPVKAKRVISPLLDVRYLFSLYRRFRKLRPDVVHNISIKPNIYGAVAARWAGIPRVVGSVTGLGNIYMDEMGFRFRLLRPLVSRLYRAAFKVTDRVWFQNPDDAEYFVTAGLVQPGKVTVIKGSGVNLDEFSPQAADEKAAAEIRSRIDFDDSSIIACMISRALKSKGVEEFIEAGEILAARNSSIHLFLVGDSEEGNALSLSREFLQSKQSDNFHWLGWRHDIREILHASDIVTLPSRFREGLPKSLLEAMSMGKPLVATDVPGCRETVEEGGNGFLVAPGDAEALADRLERLAVNPNLRRKFGKRSRELAGEHFDVNKVNRRIMEELYLWQRAN